VSAPVPPRRKEWISHRTWQILRRCYPTAIPADVLERALVMLATADGHLLPNGAIKGGNGRKPAGRQP